MCEEGEAGLDELKTSPLSSTVNVGLGLVHVETQGPPNNVFGKQNIPILEEFPMS